MLKTQQVDKSLKEKRNELIWALSLQRYTPAEISKIFGSVSHRSTATRIIAKMPKGWLPKWKKVI